MTHGSHLDPGLHGRRHRSARGVAGGRLGAGDVFGGGARCRGRGFDGSIEDGQKHSGNANLYIGNGDFPHFPIGNGDFLLRKL